MSIRVLISGIVNWLRSSWGKGIVIAAGIGLLVLAFSFQQSRLGLLQAENQAQSRTVSELTAANAGLALAVESIKADLARSRAALQLREEAHYAVQQELSRLKTRLGEIGRTDPDYRGWADTVLPDVVGGMFPPGADGIPYQD